MKKVLLFLVPLLLWSCNEDRGLFDMPENPAESMISSQKRTKAEVIKIAKDVAKYKSLASRSGEIRVDESSLYALSNRSTRSQVNDTLIEADKYIHYNWGWNGNSNGFFLAGVFDTDNKYTPETNGQIKNPLSRSSYGYGVQYFYMS